MLCFDIDFLFAVGFNTQEPACAGRLIDLDDDGNIDGWRYAR
jgi:hypothetical protein